MRLIAIKKQKKKADCCTAPPSPCRWYHVTDKLIELKQIGYHGSGGKRADQIGAKWLKHDRLPPSHPPPSTSQAALSKKCFILKKRFHPSLRLQFCNPVQRFPSSHSQSVREHISPFKDRWIAKWLTPPFLTAKAKKNKNESRGDKKMKETRVCVPLQEVLVQGKKKVK